MRRTAIMLAGFVVLLTLGATAQESRSDISLQGTGFFTRDTNGQGISRTTSDTGGFMVGYRYHFNRWLSAEGNYGFDRNTQKYFGSFGESRVQANVHTVTADLAVNLPLPTRRVSTYVLAGGGGLIFDPTGNRGGFCSRRRQSGQRRFPVRSRRRLCPDAAFFVTRRIQRFCVQEPGLRTPALNTDSWTHTAQPSAGLVFRF